MDALTTHIEYKDHVYVPYSIETLNDVQYFVYYMVNNGKDVLEFMTNKKLLVDPVYKGVLNLNHTSYLFYEIMNKEIEFLSTEKDDLWKVTPYEILYPRMVNDMPIHPECINLFKAYPELCRIKDYEVPIVAYLGLGVSEIKEQILIQNINEKDGLFGKGCYFTNYETALYDTYYKEETDDFLIRLENKLGLTDIEIEDTSVRIHKNAFYHYNYYLGDIPECNTKLNYVIYYYDEDVIYLKSVKPHHCKKEVNLRTEDGYIMRYVLFLKNHSNNKKKIGDSYAYDSTYMIKNTDDFICLSYHFIKKK